MVAAACLLTGFMTMGAMALVTTPPNGVRPLWTYWSGTIGDLLLPVIVYGFTQACAVLTPTGLPEVSAGSYVAAGIGATIGALSQAAWLLDPAPRLNWLLIAPHTFSFPGWYHAVYLIITSAYVAGVSWELLRRARLAMLASPNQVRAVLGGWGAMATLTAVGIFVLTVVADSLPSQGTSSSRATIAIIVSAPVALLALAAWRLRGAASALGRPLLLSLAVTAVGALILSITR